VKLLIRQTRDGGAHIGITLERLHSEHLTFGFRLGAGGEVFADARAADVTGYAEHDLLGGIREC